MIASGEIGEDSDLFIEKDKDPPGTPGGAHSIRVKGEVNKEAIQSSASYWYVSSLRISQPAGQLVPEAAELTVYPGTTS